MYIFFYNSKKKERERERIQNNSQKGEQERDKSTHARHFPVMFVSWNLWTIVLAA